MASDDYPEGVPGDLDLFVSYWNYYFQAENGSIKRISLPNAWFNTIRFVQTHAKGRSPSHLDTETRQALDSSPHLTYAEALISVLERYREDQDFLYEFRENLNNDERLRVDEEDFWAVFEAREAAWRRVNNDYRDPLPATVEAI